MNFLAILAGFCPHRRTSFPLTLAPRDFAHVSCLDCGREFEYVIGKGLGREVAPLNQEEKVKPNTQALPLKQERGPHGAALPTLEKS